MSVVTLSMRIAAVSAIFGVVSAMAEPPTDQQITGQLEARGDGWAALEFVDVRNFRNDEKPRFGPVTKTIFRGPEVGALLYTIFMPPWNNYPMQAFPHYHHWHEWGFTLKGDSVLYEAVSPYQKKGMMHWKPEGGWLDRPPYSLHSVNWPNSGLRRQNPYYLIIFEEGDGSIVTTGPNGDHYAVDRSQRPDPYLPDWESVEQWNPPWLVDSAHDLDWEDDPEVPGRFVKWLSDDYQGGFRAQLYKIPPGWSPGASKSYFQHANRMRYMLFGDMKVWLFDDPDDDGETLTVTEDFFVYQPPRSLWGYGDGSVTESGAFWLEVTYAKGLSHGGGPIEKPIAVD